MIATSERSAAPLVSPALINRDERYEGTRLESAPSGHLERLIGRLTLSLAERLTACDARLCGARRKLSERIFMPAKQSSPGWSKETCSSGKREDGFQANVNYKLKRNLRQPCTASLAALGDCRPPARSARTPAPAAAGVSLLSCSRLAPLTPSKRHDKRSISSKFQCAPAPAHTLLLVLLLLRCTI